MFTVTNVLRRAQWKIGGLLQSGVSLREKIVVCRTLSSKSSLSTSEENEAFQEELRVVLDDHRESQKEIAKKKYEKWKQLQEKRGDESLFKQSELGNESKENTKTETQYQEISGFSSPQDTHFNFGLRAQNESQTKEVSRMMEESLKVQLVATPYTSLTVAKSYEELGMFSHQSLEFTKAIKYYRHALTIHERLAEVKIKESGESINFSSEPVTVGNRNGALINPERNLKGEKTVVHQTSGFDEERFRYEFVTDTATGGTLSAPIVKQSVGSFDVARCLSYLG